jgi:hypothetical protein
MSKERGMRKQGVWNNPPLVAGGVGLRFALFQGFYPWLKLSTHPDYSLTRSLYVLVGVRRGHCGSTKPAVSKYKATWRGKCIRNGAYSSVFVGVGRTIRHKYLSEREGG